MSEFRQALTVQVIERTDKRLGVMVNADVQVWRGNVHVTTISLLDHAPLPVGTDFGPTCIEQFAALTSRIVARLLDEELFHRIGHGAVHTLHDMEKEFPQPDTADE